MITRPWSQGTTALLLLLFWTICTAAEQRELSIDPYRQRLETQKEHVLTVDGKNTSVIVPLEAVPGEIALQIVTHYDDFSIVEKYVYLGEFSGQIRFNYTRELERRAANAKLEFEKQLDLVLSYTPFYQGRMYRVIPERFRGSRVYLEVTTRPQSNSIVPLLLDK